ncbi:hypothetical protein [Castellaniella sp. MT123]|uniref:hypothetical protein n=1 Tax=Castellaniella sp. MT123 TaxID=3140381 RepID=UPI0031F399E0
MEIPDNFPRRKIMSSVAGKAPKLAVRKTADGQYSNYVDDTEHLQAYENAEDLAQQFKKYGQRKEREHPEWTREFNLSRIGKGIETKVRSSQWDITPDEQQWIMKRLTQLLDEPPNDV